METKVLKVKGMTCGHCRAAVQEALQEVPGVIRAEVNLEAGEATVELDPAKATMGAMKAAVEDAGYEIVA